MAMSSKRDLEHLRQTIQEQLVHEVAKDNLFTGQDLVEKKRIVINKIREIIQRKEQAKVPIVLSAQEKELIAKEIIDELIGFGPIDELMKDDAVSEIMINGPDRVYVEKAGRKLLSSVRFKNINQLNHLIQKLLSFAGRKVDETTPYVDASLEDRTRVNIILPPLSLQGPVVTIRKLAKEITRIEDLINLGTLTKQTGEFLIACVRGRINMIFSGATGVGKTTTLGVLTGCVAPDERIVVIEDTSELTFHQDHVLRLQARLPNIEGRGEITIRDLLKNSLRMRPDRIVIGELRGGEALDMLQAMASGHSGAMGVIHAASPEDVISRLESMIATSGVNIPLWTIRKYIANNLNLIIQQEHLADGSRKVVNIAEVRGLKQETVILKDIFIFVQEGIKQDGTIVGRLQATGTVPLFLAKLEEKGIKLDAQIFTKE